MLEEKLSQLIGEIYDAALRPELWPRALGEVSGFVGGGLVDDVAMSRMRLIAPHICRAALIGHAINLRTSEAVMFADTLDGLAAGMFLVDKASRIVHANVSGQAMLDEGTVLRSARGRLTATRVDADRMLKDILAGCCNADTAAATKGVAMPLEPASSGQHVAHVLPLGAGTPRRTGSAYAAVAAVFVHRAELESPSQPEALAKAYDLTAMELTVLVGIVHIGGGPAVAQIFGISEATVRTHLKHIFQKTKTNRQAELVKLVAAFESPLLDPKKSQRYLRNNGQ
jgi:DNA-binding CsgD family transcriptional regulator